MRAHLSHFLFLFLIATSLQVDAQVEDTLTGKSLLSYSNAITNKVQRTDQQISSLTQRALTKLKKQEQKLYRKLYKIDSVAAKNIFFQSANHYKEAQQKITITVQQVQSKFSGEYISYLDTLTNSIAFIKEGKDILNKSKEVQQNLKVVSEKVKALNNTVQQTEQLKKYITLRKEYLKNQLSKYTSLSKDLTKLNKTVFYYSQQVRDVKEALKDPKKAEQKVLALLRENRMFQDFIKKNSFLAGIFDIPADYGTSGVGSLQTRMQVNAIIQTRMNVMGPNAQQQIQQNVQAGQQQLSTLRNQFPFLNFSSEMPDFKPNMERTKQLKKRFEMGSNIQTVRAQTYFPTTTDFALSIGYRLNEKSVIGIGSSVKMGWGTGIDNIQITCSGYSLRSFIDWKLKGGFWLSGGYELNYLSASRRITYVTFKNVQKQSALFGLSKIVDMKSRFFKKTKIQILYDVFWKIQNPVTEPVKFRIGYNF
ncbi:hypothetical protein PDL71_01905 [Lacibacter sp. MH-610]|uniref:hypothetical protein n=1 Tax=Lacibacter sp. MH-610 TaxID=3020883 RepID=UPI003891A0ED